jgi:hypothetical protein
LGVFALAIVFSVSCVFINEREAKRKREKKLRNLKDLTI